MSLNHHLPKKVSLVPKKHHGFQFLLFLMGLLLPPIAVAARFGVGSDLFINIFLCICGYFPCHFHNFYIQNIRNNTNRTRTPKWALKAGLVDDSDIRRKKAKNAWAGRFDERTAQSTHVGQALEEGEEGDNYDPALSEDPEVIARRRNEGLWTGDEEEYYNPDAAPNQQHWHYPANFEGAVAPKKKKGLMGLAKGGSRADSSTVGDRWERTRSRTDSEHDLDPPNVYPPAGATDNDVPEWGKDYGAKSKKKANKSSKKGGGTASNWAENNFVQDRPVDDGYGNGRSNGSSRGGGGRSNGGYGYDDMPNGNARRANGTAGGARKNTSQGDGLDHEF